MLRQCRTITKTIEPFDRLRESERAPEIRRPFFWLLKNGFRTGSPKHGVLTLQLPNAEESSRERLMWKSPSLIGIFGNWVLEVI